MNEYDSIINDYVEAPASQAATSIGESPDQAVRARQLSRATNQPVLAIYNDLDNAEQEHRAALTRNIVSGNDKLAAYIRGNELADVVSNDDYGNLDNIGRASKNVLDHGSDTGLKAWVPGPKDVFGPAIDATRNYISTALREGTKGAFQSLIEGFGYDFSKGDFNFYMDEALNKYSPGFTERNPYSAEAYRALELIPRTIIGTTMSPINAAAGFLGGAGTSMASQLGADSSANQLKRELPEVVMQGVMGQNAPHVAEGAGNIIRAVEATRAAKRWLDAGVDVPRSVHPLIDQIKEKTNDAWVDKIQNALQEAQTSFTKERDPELFKSYMKEYFADAQMGISADAVVRLYGDKVPSREDGILGWVPGIEEKLKAAKTFGEDVHVPLADWVTYVDPQLASELKPDLRAWPGGITKNEAAVKDLAAPAIDGALPQVRSAAGLEPAFAIGDRRLELKREAETNPFEGMDPQELAKNDGLVWEDMSAYERRRYIDAVNGNNQRQHSWEFHDEQGNVVGQLLINPNAEAKQLYVDWIGGLGKFGPSSFGPSLIRDIKRQLKEAYPEYETIAGHRVSGARYSDKMIEQEAKRLAEKDGFKWDELVPSEMTGYMDEAFASYKNPTDRVSIKLHIDDMANDYNSMKGLFDQAYMRQFDQGVEGFIIPKGLYRDNELALTKVVEEELARITPGVEFVPTGGLYYDGLSDIRGVYIEGLKPQILLDMISPNAKNVAHHEAIHHLRRAGLFSKAEWAALEEAAIKEKWIEKYQIEDRYESFDTLSKYEESIAEAFRDWASTKDTVAHPQNFVTQAFQKLWDFLQRIKSRFAEILGREPTIEDLFQKAYSGEVGSRKPNPQMQVPSEPLFSKGELETQLKAEAAGLDAKSFKRIQDLIQKRYQEDIAAAMKRVEAEQKTLQSKEWKAAAKEIRKEVEADIKQRPDVAADLLIGSGELGGKQLERKNYPLRAEDLTEAQKASLPRRYYSKDGVPVDMMANLFGFTSGDRLVEELSSYTKSREGMSAQEGLRKTIDEEVQRRMEEKFGKLQDNIMLEAMDQALSETNLQILAEEWQGAAMAAGVKVVDKDIAKGEALAMFGKMKLSDINVERLMGIMGKIGRDTERLLIAGKNADALVLMQRKYMTGLIAAEARKLQKEQASFEKTAKQYSKREVDSTDPEYTNYIHQILMQVGKPVRRSMQDLAHQIEGYGGKNLEEFVQEKAGALREIPVWDQLYDPNWNKSFDQLTADEFRALHGSIKALVHNGRDELKIMRQGEAEDLAVVKQQMIQNVIDAAKREHATLNKGPVKKFLTNYYVGHLQMENIFNRWDKFDSKGVWNQYIMRDLIDGANQKDAWLKEYAHQLKQLPEPEGLTRTLDNPLFKDQDTGAALPFTRKNLIAVMLNTGNSSNLAKLAKGYKIEPNDVMAWVHQHASKRDWEFVQGVWDMFADIKEKSDTMYRSLTGGVAPESIPIRPVDTPHGQFKGGYYPIIFHSEMEGKSKKLMGKDPLEQENYVRATTPAGYTKTRTGYAAPMALELDAMPGRIGQMLHDIALRPAVLNAAKVFYDHDVRSAIRAHFGAEYRDELVPYLRGVANASNYESKAQTTMNQMSEFIRQNMITTLVGLNPGTVMKHGPTAAVLSAREVGAEPFAKAVRGMFSVNEATGESNWQFAIKNSLELQRRDRNWAETLYGSATGVLAPGDKLTPMRQKIMELSSKPVALSDMISAVPTWLAKYESEINAGATHGDAVFEADRSVRRAHGSTAITTRTAMMRNSNPWLVSIYNFFSDVMNRQMETIWKAGETKDLVKQGEWKEAAKTVPALTASLFAYAIWPAIVETWVSPHPHKDDDSWLKKSAMAMTFALGSSWVGVRDIASAMTMGRDPQFGLTGTAYQTMTNTFRDLAKKEPFNKEHAGKILQDAGIMVGGLTGMLPAQVSKGGRFLFDVNSGQQKPKGPWQWLTGLRYGTIEKHPATFEDYLKGKH